MYVSIGVHSTVGKPQLVTPSMHTKPHTNVATRDCIADLWVAQLLVA